MTRLTRHSALIVLIALLAALGAIVVVRFIQPWQAGLPYADVTHAPDESETPDSAAAAPLALATHAADSLALPDDVNEQPVANPDTTVATTTPESQIPASKPTASPLQLPLPGTTTPAISDPGDWSLSLHRVVWALIVFVLAWIAFRYVTRLLEFIGERRPRQRVTIKAAIPVIRILGWTLVLYFIVSRIFAPPIQTLLALTASAGIAVGFAAQDILKNIFGGIMILFDRPFSVGDKIQIKEHYGEVINIGLRTVRIVTPDDSEVSIPNAEVAASPVSNANSGASNCQVVAEFFLPSSVDLAAVRKVAYRAATVSRYTFLNKPIAVVFKNEIHEGRSLIKMRLKVYVLDIRFEFAHISDLTQIVMEELIAQDLVDPADLGMLAKRG